MNSIVGVLGVAATFEMSSRSSCTVKVENRWLTCTCIHMHSWYVCVDAGITKCSTVPFNAQMHMNTFIKSMNDEAAISGLSS